MLGCRSTEEKHLPIFLIDLMSIILNNLIIKCSQALCARVAWHVALCSRSGPCRSTHSTETHLITSNQHPLSLALQTTKRWAFWSRSIPTTTKVQLWSLPCSSRRSKTIIFSLYRPWTRSPRFLKWPPCKSTRLPPFIRCSTEPKLASTTFRFAAPHLAC